MKSDEKWLFLQANFPVTVVEPSFSLEGRLSVFLCLLFSNLLLQLNLGTAHSLMQSWPEKTADIS